MGVVEDVVVGQLDDRRAVGAKHDLPQTRRRKINRVQLGPLSLALVLPRHRRDQVVGVTLRACKTGEKGGCGGERGWSVGIGSLFELEVVGFPLCASFAAL